LRGPTSKERGREGRGGEGREGKERAMSPPLFGGSLRLCMQLKLVSSNYSFRYLAHTVNCEK